MQTWDNINFKDSQGSIDVAGIKGKFCNRPYTWLEINSKGDVYLCCPSWLPYPIGNLLETPMHGIWNGEKAQKIRQQMFTDRWIYCHHTFCPSIAGNSLMDMSQAKVSENKRIQHIALSQTLIAPELPDQINLANDESCNLSCPSCRTHKINHSKGPDYERRKELNDRIVQTFLTEPTDRAFTIYCTGSGDPFASKIFREMLTNIDGSLFPNLEIGLNSNGVMFTPKIWHQLHKIHANIGHTRISLDAGSKQVYEKVRLGGDWDLLMKNCSFLNEQVGINDKFTLNFDFVVQWANYKDIPKYVELCLTKFPNLNTINFGLINDWFTWSSNEYEKQCIWKNTHPEYYDFLNILKDPILSEAKVSLRSLRPYVGKALNEDC